MKQQSIKGTFKGGFHKGNKKEILNSGRQILISNEPEAVEIMCASGECLRCPRTKVDCGHSCHVSPVSSR